MTILPLSLDAGPLVVAMRRVPRSRHDHQVARRGLFVRAALDGALAAQRQTARDSPRAIGVARAEHDLRSPAPAKVAPRAQPRPAGPVPPRMPTVAIVVLEK